MDTKSALFGAALLMASLLLIGGAYAAIAGSGQTINVPVGKTMIYFTMNTEDALYLRDALCHNYGYQETIIDAASGEEIPNPQSCADFGQQKIVLFAKDHMAAYHKWQYDNGYAEEDWTVTG